MKIKKINLKLINSFNPCYSPEKIGMTSDMNFTPLEFIDKFENKVKNNEDILWLLCRKEFMSDRDLRLFAVWCARGALKLIESPDERSVNACNVAEEYANSTASESQLTAARAAARAAAWAAASDAAWAASDAAWAARAAASDAAWDAARAAAWDVARAAAWDAQIKQLKTYFKI